MQVRDAFLAGDLHDATMGIAALAALASRKQDWATLPPVVAPWPRGDA